MRRKTEEDYRALAEKYGIKIIGKLPNTTKDKTLWLCKNGHQFESDYDHIRQGKLCKKCAVIALAEKRKIKPSMYIELANERGFKWLGPEVKNSQTKTMWRCSKGHIWSAHYNNIKTGRGCPYCSNRVPKTENDFHKLARFRKFKWIGKNVIDTQTGTDWQCLNGHIWRTSYNNIKNGRGCPYCSQKIKKIPDDFNNIAKKYGFEWVGELPKNNKENTDWKCSKGHIWPAPYASINRGQGCPMCRESKGERSIRIALSQWMVKYKRQKTFDGCTDKKVLQFDFYAHVNTTTGPAYFLIEYDGIQHFKPLKHYGGLSAFQATQRRDRIKTEFAARHNIPLIRISYKQKHKIRRILRDAIIQHTGVDPLDQPEPAEHGHAKPVDVVPEDYRQGRLF